MVTRVIGLDVGTYAVRAAELTLGRDRPVLSRFGQIALPPGAVVEGEVIDTAAVSTAVKRLWAETGFRGTRVVVGVANQRVVVRQIELPQMSEQDLRSALRFEVEELIPIPIEEAILDFQILENVVGPEGEALMRVLIVAAQRDMVRNLLDAVEGGGVKAVIVDLVPFALMRLFAVDTLGLDGDRPAQAIVSIGAGVSHVIVHERGLPRFVRTLILGGADITERLAADLDVDLDTAEALKRTSELGGDEQAQRAAQHVRARVGPLVEEVRGSIDFYLAQPGSAPIDRVVLTGGGSRLPGLAAQLRVALALPVEEGRALDLVEIGETGISEEHLRDNEALLATPLGLALAGRRVESGDRRITMLPVEVLVAREERRQLGLVAGAVAALVVLLLVLWVVRGSQVDSERTKAEVAENEGADVRLQVNALEGVAAQEALLQQKREQAAQLVSAEVAWTRLVQEIATVLPSDVWLTSFAGSGLATPGGVPTGSLSVALNGFDMSSAARWLLRVADVRSVSDVWLPSSSVSASDEGRPVSSFSSTAILTPAAGSERAARYRSGSP